MAKKLVDKQATKGRAKPAPEAPIEIRLMKIKANEVIILEYAQGNISHRIVMTDPAEQRPVEEYYDNFRTLAYHMTELAELPDYYAASLRPTGIRLKYDGEGQMSARLIGWKELKSSSGGYSIVMPWKHCGDHETSTTDGDQKNDNGSNLIRHSDDCTKIILRQIELAKNYIHGDRGAIGLFDKQEEDDDSESESED